VNTNIGSILCQKQWKLLLNQKGDTICKVSLTNNKAWLFVDNVDELVNHVFSAVIHEQRKAIWLKLICYNRDAMGILWKRSEYTESDIHEFQLKINDFFVASVEESGAGKEGVTNYILMLGSGHVAYYIKTHGNLYKFSQQGQEGFNEKVKLSFFNHTQCRGNFGTDTAEQERSYLRSIFMFFQWELLWISGIAEQHFLNAQLEYD
jgi:hypothetical protein